MGFGRPRQKLSTKLPRKLLNRPKDLRPRKREWDFPLEPKHQRQGQKQSPEAGRREPAARDFPRCVPTQRVGTQGSWILFLKASEKAKQCASRRFSYGGLFAEGGRKGADNIPIEFIGTGSGLFLRKGRRTDLEDMDRKGPWLVDRRAKATPRRRVRHPRFFRSTSLIGSFQDDGEKKKQVPRSSG
jgi:hypothetical protein